jgi:hypothetical protein
LDQCGIETADEAFAFGELQSSSFNWTSVVLKLVAMLLIQYSHCARPFNWTSVVLKLDGTNPRGLLPFNWTSVVLKLFWTVLWVLTSVGAFNWTSVVLKPGAIFTQDRINPFNWTSVVLKLLG